MRALTREARASVDQDIQRLDLVTKGGLHELIMITK